MEELSSYPKQLNIHLKVYLTWNHKAALAAGLMDWTQTPDATLRIKGKIWAQILLKTSV